MSPKSTFTKAHVELLLNTLRKHRPRFWNQEQLALAIGLSQPSLSTMLKGKWRPGVTTARAIANLDGQTLEELLGDWQQEEQAPAPAARAPVTTPDRRYPNLSTCISFHLGVKHWSPWTVAAAAAGYYGDQDFPAPMWVAKLDELEAILAKGRKDKP